MPSTPGASTGRGASGSTSAGIGPRYYYSTVRKGREGAEANIDSVIGQLKYQCLKL